MIDYQHLVQESLLNVVRSILKDAQENGVLDPHHFYITFQTKHTGVVLPAFLQERYPEEMTIVLQYQFENLNVADDFFEVDLSFNNQLQRLHIPFAAILSFADPSEQFGLQFMPALSHEKPARKENTEPAQVIDLNALRNKK